MSLKPRVLVCGVLPPPYFGHSMLYQMLMRSSFTQAQDVTFLDMHFWSYKADKKITVGKLLKLVWYFGRYLWLILKIRPQYVLYNISFYKMPFLKDLLFCATGIVLGRKVIIHDHGQYVRELHEALPGWQKFLLRWMLRRMAAAVIMGEQVRSAYEGLAEQAKLFVVPGVVEDTLAWDVVPDRVPGRLNVLYFSHLSRSKGALVAFDAAREVLKYRRDVVITFAGPVEDGVAAPLDALGREFPDQGRYLGYIDDARRRAAIFRGADVFMFTTLRDVFGLVLLHAMAEGKPVVASREGTIPGIVADGKSGFLFEKGNARICAGHLLRLLADAPLCEEMGREGRVRYEKIYAIEHYGASMTRVIDALKGAGPGLGSQEDVGIK